MTAQYSNRQFFRKAPNLYLGQYFAVKGLLAGLDFSELKENDGGALQNALNNAKTLLVLLQPVITHSFGSMTIVNTLPLLDID